MKNDVSIQAVSSLAELTSACSSTDPEALARCEDFLVPDIEDAARPDPLLLSLTAL